MRALQRLSSLNAQHANPVPSPTLGAGCACAVRRASCVLVPTRTMQVLATVVRAEADRDLTFKPANSNKKLVRHNRGLEPYLD